MRDGESDNPFAAPAAPTVGAAGNPEVLIEVQGKHLVLESGAVLPSRCFRCNAICGDDDRTQTRTLYFFPALGYLLILVNMLVLIIVYFLIRKPFTLTFSECAKHVAQQRMRGLLCVASLVAAILLIAAGSSMDQPLLAGLGLIAVVAFLVFLVLANRGLAATKHVKGAFWVSGACPAMLNDLSEAGTVQRS